jgi:adenylate cyclase
MTQPRPRTSRRTLREFSSIVGIGAAAALLAVAAGRGTEFLQRVENTSYDRRVAATARPVRSDSPIVLVDINESSVRALEPMLGRWPWPRAVHAAALDYIVRGGARVVAFDILFGEREGYAQTIINGQAMTGDRSDAAFVESVRLAGRVVLLAGATYEGLASTAGAGEPLPQTQGREYRVGPGWYRRPDLQLPFHELGAAAWGVGHNVLMRDPGSDFARRMLPFIDVQGRTVPSLGLAATLAFLDVPTAEVAFEEATSTLRIGTAHLPLTSDVRTQMDGALEPTRQALLRFQEPVEGADGVTSMFNGVSYFDVLLSADQLAAGQSPAVPPSTFEGKLVFVGTSAAGAFDEYQTPFGDDAGGVELHATLAENVLAQQFMRRASTSIDALTTGVAAMAASAAAGLLPVAWAVVVVAVLIVGLIWGLTVLVGNGLWMGLVVPVLAAALSLLGGIAWQYFVAGRDRRQIRDLFSRYVSKDVIAELMADPSRARLGGQRREMTVLFSDIRGFTTASEAGTPEAVVAQLNEYFGEMVAVLFRHQGTLDKFVGDMVMGLFGAPLADAHHADHAVAAGLEMVASLERLNARWQAEGRPALDIGIGINTGEMIAGNIGAEAIMSYTVIGDAVNLGARLESLNKDYGTHILISEATRARLTRPVATREIGAVTVKGKTRAVVVHEVITGRPGNGTTGASS